MFNTFSLFSIDAHVVNIEDWSEKHRDRLLSLVPDKDKRVGMSEDDKSILEVSRIEYSDYLNNEKPPYYDELIKVLTPYLEEFFKKHNITQPRIASLWCQKYKAGDYHGPHDHGSIGYSAVLYAKLNTKFHSGTQFFSPFPNERGTKLSISLKVEEGDLVIFPAHLLHMAPSHHGDENRVIFSFNIM